jgi:hypothetical protein
MSRLSVIGGVMLAAALLGGCKASPEAGANADSPSQPTNSIVEKGRDRIAGTLNSPEGSAPSTPDASAGTGDEELKAARDAELRSYERVNNLNMRTLASLKSTLQKAQNQKNSAVAKVSEIEAEIARLVGQSNPNDPEVRTVVDRFWGEVARFRVIADDAQGRIDKAVQSISEAEKEVRESSRNLEDCRRKLGL